MLTLSLQYYSGLAYVSLLLVEIVHIIIYICNHFTVVQLNVLYARLYKCFKGFTIRVI